MKARPISAGLNRLKPSPPNSALPKTIANAEPTNAIHGATSGGSVMASRSPVQKALPSRTVRVGRPSARCIAASASSAPRIEATSTRTAGQPKMNMPHSAAGASAPLTHHMMREVVSAAWTCGPGPMMNVRSPLTIPPLLPARGAATTWRSA